MSKCKHESQVGAIGEKYYMCMDCGAKVFNPTWEEDRKSLEDATPEPQKEDDE